MSPYLRNRLPRRKHRSSSPRSNNPRLLKLHQPNLLSNRPLHGLILLKLCRRPLPRLAGLPPDRWLRLRNFNRLSQRLPVRLSRDWRRT